MTLRPATSDDCRVIWEWRNEEETRRASFDSSEIPYEAHQSWFRDSLERRERKMYVALADGRPCGVVRLDLSGPKADVSIFLTRAYHGRGIGPRALEAIAEIGREALSLESLWAEVKADNYASLSAFRKAGFAGRPSKEGVWIMVKQLGEDSKKHEEARPGNRGTR